MILRGFVVLLLLAGVAAAQQTLTVVRVAAGLDTPVWVGAPSADRDRLFVCEQGGGVRIVRGGQLLAQPFLDLSGLLVAGGEQGLLGMAFHPAYAQNGYFYVYYTRRLDGASIVARYSVSALDPDVANPNSGLVVLGPVFQPNIWHNAGCLQFGPDGYLYIALGDGGGGGCTAQRGDVLLGKILRIDVDGGTPYAIPPSNPYVGNPLVLDEIWSRGLRNPWRFSFDRLTGDMYIGDVGWRTKEEISFQAASSAGGENWGWDVMEGTSCFQTFCGTACNAPQLSLPLHEYAYGSGGNRCVVGGHVYRGCAMPEFDGAYFFGDFTAGTVWSLRHAGGQVTSLVNHSAELTGMSRITSFGEDADGEIHVTSVRGVYRIVPNVPSPATNLGFGTAGTAGRVPQLTLCGLLGAGQGAELRLRRAPPRTAAALLVSTSQNPVQLPWGTVVPVPPQIVAGLTTDANGEVALPVAGGLGPATLFTQCLVLDPGAVMGGGITVSNALAIAFP